MLILSIKEKINIPNQTLETDKIKKLQLTKAVGSGFIASSLCGFLPGLGASQAAIIATTVSKKWSTKTFILLVGAVNTIVLVMSIVALYTIQKARNGIIVTISKIIPEFTQKDLILFLTVSLIAGIIATFLTLKIGKVFSKYITKVNYQKLCISIIIFITILVFFISGPIGLLVLLISTFMGIIPAAKGIGRNHLMGSLLIPVILFFLL